MLQFIEEQDKWLIGNHGSSDVTKRILARTVKLSEEIGELSEAVLSFLGDQRSDKIDNFEKTQLEDELVDVMIVTLLIGKAVGADIQMFLERKINGLIKIRKIPKSQQL